MFQVCAFPPQEHAADVSMEEVEHDVEVDPDAELAAALAMGDLDADGIPKSLLAGTMPLEGDVLVEEMVEEQTSIMVSMEQEEEGVDREEKEDASSDDMEEEEVEKSPKIEDRKSPQPTNNVGVPREVQPSRKSCPLWNCCRALRSFVHHHASTLEEFKFNIPELNSTTPPAVYIRQLDELFTNVLLTPLSAKVFPTPPASHLTEPPGVIPYAPPMKNVEQYNSKTCFLPFAIELWILKWALLSRCGVPAVRQFACFQGKCMKTIVDELSTVVDFQANKRNNCLRVRSFFVYPGKLFARTVGELLGGEVSRFVKGLQKRTKLDEPDEGLGFQVYPQLRG